MFRHQYGFLKGKSTIDAIMELKTLARTTTMGIFADIKGAFDRVWWPDILNALRAVRCPRNLYLLIKSCLNDREVTASEHGNQITRSQNRGCPQGSVLGPILWNMVFDPLLGSLANLEHCHPVAYADDLEIVVNGNSRIQLENRAHQATHILESWCDRHKMLLSTDKTVALMLKGKLDPERPPTIKTQAGTLKFKPAVKYLSLILDRGLKFHSHAKYVGDKAKLIMQKYAAICGLKWGVGNKEMTTIYRGSFIPIIAYAAEAWIDEFNDKTKRPIIGAHRCALIRITKAYRTTITEALEVLANIQPIYNELLIEKLWFCIRRSNLCIINNTEYDIFSDKNMVINQLKTNLIANWQISWQNSTKGRITFDFFSNILTRATKTWIAPS